MMNLSPEKMRKIVEESVLSVQPADVKKYHGKSIPVGPQKLSSMKEKQIVNATAALRPAVTGKRSLFFATAH